LKNHTSLMLEDSGVHFVGYGRSLSVLEKAGETKMCSQFHELWRSFMKILTQPFSLL
jgi:hypothetical protein